MPAILQFFLLLWLLERTQPIRNPKHIKDHQSESLKLYIISYHIMLCYIYYTLQLKVDSRGTCIHIFLGCIIETGLTLKDIGKILPHRMGHEHILISKWIWMIWMSGTEIQQSAKYVHNWWDVLYINSMPLGPTWISNHMSSKMWNEITYPFPNFNG